MQPIKEPAHNPAPAHQGNELVELSKQLVHQEVHNDKQRDKTNVGE